MRNNANMCSHQHSSVLVREENKTLYGKSSVSPIQCRNSIHISSLSCILFGISIVRFCRKYGNFTTNTHTKFMEIASDMAMRVWLMYLMHYFQFLDRIFSVQANFPIDKWYICTAEKMKRSMLYEAL